MGASKGLLFLPMSIYVILIRHECSYFRSNKTILLVSSHKVEKYENVTSLCKWIIGFYVYPKTLIGLKYNDTCFPEIDNYYYA